MLILGTAPAIRCWRDCIVVGAGKVYGFDSSKIHLWLIVNRSRVHEVLGLLRFVKDPVNL